MNGSLQDGRIGMRVTGNTVSSAAKGAA
jgi:hypothetical protein